MIKNPRCCNVIAFWSGIRANKSYHLERDDYDMQPLVEYLYHIHKTIDGGMDYDTIIVCNLNPDSPPAEELLKTLDGKKSKNGKFIIEFRENQSISFGAYNHAYQKYKDDYDYFFFTEDDHIYNRENWYKVLYDKFNSKENIGYVAAKGVGKEYGPHAHGGLGLTSTEVLNKLANLGSEHRTSYTKFLYEDGREDTRFRLAEKPNLQFYVFPGEEYVEWDMLGHCSEAAFTSHIEQKLKLELVDIGEKYYIKWYEDYGPILTEEDWKLIKNGVKSKMKPISFIQPSRNNLKYLKWSYNSIRKNLGYFHEICMADDFSNDGTWEWMQEIAEKDKNVKIHRNEGPTRLGHTILYDTLINDYATNDIVMIYHADMYAGPGLDEEIDKHIKPGVVVSATRIEPPLHPKGPEKIIWDFGIEPEEFDEQEFLIAQGHFATSQKTTNGIFAPWAIYKSDFQSIGGHDELFAPQSKEDSDIFNRFKLAGYEFIQTWSGFVYHMTCRGSRLADGAKRNPDGEVFMKNRETDEWLKQNQRSTRNFIRKWGHIVKHDEMLHPSIPHKYDIGFVVKNATYPVLLNLEPWCSSIYVDDQDIIDNYLHNERHNTSIDLSKRVFHIDDEKTNDVIIEFDCNQLADSEDTAMNFISNLSDILTSSGKEGQSMKWSIFKLKINKLKTYEEELIKCES